jgi:hypothetical protein
MNELQDPLWRLSNLYSIKDEQTGRSIPFSPRDEQKEVINHLINEPQVPIYIIKSRRLGMSTNLGLFMADNAVFNSGFKGSLIDQNQADAHRKMADIMRFGIMSLPEPILKTLEFPKRNDGEMTLQVKGKPETSVSTIYAGMGARGGTSSMLWVSEWGPIAATDPTRSREIRTGALPSARQGMKVVETTWYGGKTGDLWELIKPILEKDPNAEGRVLFFPWHGDPACVKISGEVPSETEEYFKELSGRLSRTFSREQKQWYTSRKIEQGIFIKREYPSTLEEAMTAPVEGSIYGDYVSRAREEGRIVPYPVDQSAPVWTFWDLGSPSNTAVVYAQFLNREIRIVDMDVGFDGTLMERVAHMMAKGYPYHTHVLPHDSGQTRTSGRTFAQELKDAGMPNIRILPRTQDKWIGINRVAQMFSQFVFRMPMCEEGIVALENYHTRRVSNGVINTDDVVHDDSSHLCDAMRYLAEASMLGMIAGCNSEVKQDRRNMRGPVQAITGFRG